MKRRAFLAGLLALAAAPVAARVVSIVAPEPEPLALLDGANQSGARLYVRRGLSHPLMVGDIITISGLNGPDGQIRQFVVTAAVAAGERVIIHIYPPIVPVHSESIPVAGHRPTVDKSPANGAEVKLVEWEAPEQRQEPVRLGMRPLRREDPA